MPFGIDRNPCKSKHKRHICRYMYICRHCFTILKNAKAFFKSLYIKVQESISILKMQIPKVPKLVLVTCCLFSFFDKQIIPDTILKCI